MPGIPIFAHELFSSAAFRPPPSIHYPAAETQYYPTKYLLAAHHATMYSVSLRSCHGDTPSSLSRASGHTPATVVLIMQHRNRAFGYRVGYFGSQRAWQLRATLRCEVGPGSRYVPRSQRGNSLGYAEFDKRAALAAADSPAV